MTFAFDLKSELQTIYANYERHLINYFLVLLLFFSQSITTPDPTSYVTKARVTRPTPPPPSKNPMQFVQIKPCNLYQTAQQQLKKAEEVKKLKEVKKEEPEEWQNVSMVNKIAHIIITYH